MSSNDSEEHTVGDILHRGSITVSLISSSARLDSELLLASVMGVSRTVLLVNSDRKISPENIEKFRGLIERRKQGEPAAYILGHREFWGLEFQVNRSVLVPRPDSELLVEEALKFVGDSTALKFIDLGVGSGCLSIAIVSELVKKTCDVRCVGVDISDAAITVARMNAKKLGVSERISYVLGSWFDRRDLFDPPYDLIVANPPYVDRNEKVPVDLSYEPSSALFAEEHGLREARIIIEQSVQMLRPGGVLFLEVGAGKRARLPSLLAPFEQSFETLYLGDDTPLDRFTVLRMTRR